MRRPGWAGLFVLFAFVVVFAVEFHTLLGMLGVEVAAQVYFPAAAAAVIALFAAIMLFTDDEADEDGDAQAATS